MRKRPNGRPRKDYRDPGGRPFLSEYGEERILGVHIFGPRKTRIAQRQSNSKYQEYKAFLKRRNKVRRGMT